MKVFFSITTVVSVRESFVFLINIYTSGIGEVALTNFIPRHFPVL